MTFFEALVDRFGHGTHVAGIIAGHAVSNEKHPLRAVRYERDEDGNVSERPVPLSAISGVAPGALRTQSSMPVTPSFAAK